MLTAIVPSKGQITIPMAVREKPGFGSTVVLVEIVWVLSLYYETSRSEIAALPERMFRVK